MVVGRTHLGLQIGPVTVAVLGYQFPDAADYWDGNWLVVDIRTGKTLRINRDPCLRTDELHQFHEDVSAMIAGAPMAKLVPMEPYFQLVLTKNADTDKIAVSARIWSSGAKEQETISFDLGADDLSKLRCDLDEILKEFPVRARDVH